MAAKSITQSKITTNNLVEKRSKILARPDLSDAGLYKMEKDAIEAEKQRLAGNPQQLVGPVQRPNIAGRMGKVIPGVRGAKTIAKIAKRFSRVFLFFTVAPWLCLCCFIFLGLFVVKRSLDQPVTTIINLIEVGGCTIGTADSNKCIMQQFYSETTQYLTDAVSEDNI